LERGSIWNSHPHRQTAELPTQPASYALRTLPRVFVPSIVRVAPVKDINPITFFGQQVVEKHPVLKTWAAVRDQIALGVPDSTAQLLRAAVNRLFSARFKQRHVLRTAHQAMGFVARED
jgi:hypothetical protein